MEKHEQDKPHINVGTMRHVDHQKCTATNAGVHTLLDLMNDEPKKNTSIVALCGMSHDQRTLMDLHFDMLSALSKEQQDHIIVIGPPDKYVKPIVGVVTDTNVSALIESIKDQDLSNAPCMMVIDSLSVADEVINKPDKSGESLSFPNATESFVLQRTTFDDSDDYKQTFTNHIPPKRNRGKGKRRKEWER